MDIYLAVCTKNQKQKLLKMCMPFNQAILFCIYLREIIWRIYKNLSARIFINSIVDHPPQNINYPTVQKYSSSEIYQATLNGWFNKMLINWTIRSYYATTRNFLFVVMQRHLQSTIFFLSHQHASVCPLICQICAVHALCFRNYTRF